MPINHDMDPTTPLWRAAAGLILLGMGAGYARSLAQQNRPPG